MERFLLFDSGCSLCTELASAIEREAGGWLKARSLREPEVKALLDRAQPNWRWEPTLMEVEAERVRVFTGFTMRARLLTGLGPKRAWRIVKLVRQAGVQLVELGLGRREFLKRAGALLAALGVPPIFKGMLPAQYNRPPGSRPHPLERVGVKSTKRLEGDELKQALVTAVESQDARNIWASNGMPALDKVVAARHILEDDNELLAVGWPIIEGEMLIYYSLSKPIGNYRTQAMRLKELPEKAIVMTDTSVNGRRRTPVEEASRAGDCGGCVQWNWYCVASYAGACALCGLDCAVCIGAPNTFTCGACLICMLVVCPFGLASCCEQWAYSVPARINA